MAYKRIGTFVLIAIAICSSAFGAFCQQNPLEQVGSWSHITGFAINDDENYMVVSSLVENNEKLFESYLIEGQWSELKPIVAINTYLAGTPSNISKPFLSYDGKKLFFQASFADSKGGYDIYYSKRKNNGWGEPVNIGEPINSEADECSPSITPGEESLFFSIVHPENPLKKPKGSHDCEIIFHSTRSKDGKWTSPLPVHDAINRGCECTPTIGPDGKTLYFSSIDPLDYRNGFNVYNAQMLFADFWRLPIPFAETQTKISYVNPRYAGGNLYVLAQAEEKKKLTGRIYKLHMDTDLAPLQTIESTGKILTLNQHEPVEATLMVFDPITLKVLGTFYSDKQDGEYKLQLLDNLHYLVEVRKLGYSFASFNIDYRGTNKRTNPPLIELFDAIELNLSVYDQENLKPLEAQVTATRVDNHKQQITAQMVQPGLYRLVLPLGSNYTISANAQWFTDNQFLFKLEEDIIFSSFFRNLPLTPNKKLVTISIFDSENHSDLSGNVLITNLNRDETIHFAAGDVKDGKVSVLLREGDSYEFVVQGVQGYSFSSQVINLAHGGTEQVAMELVSLTKETSIRLNNINFGFNSADLTADSFAELDRVVTLIMDNPTIKIEIAAHTDNIGNADYNLKLSEKRAKTVVDYLFDNDVPTERIVAKGYGLKKPMVPNDTEENRALNRRVEFSIIEVMDLDEM